MTKLFALALFLLPVPATAQGVVSAADPRATEAGQEMLRAGGSATDAAIAMLLALNVVEPQSSGIGGGGFIVHHGGKTGLLDTIDGRETAPAAAGPNRFLGPDGKPLPFLQAWPGGFSVGVPGSLRLAESAHRKWGKLPWARLFDPAVRLADQGFVVNARLSGAVTRNLPLWKDFPAIRALYARDGQPLREGDTFRNPAMAAFLRRVAAEGPEAFYAGDNARKLSEAVTEAPRNPVPLTVADLASYRAKDRRGVCGPYRQWTVCGMGPPSSGALTVLQILGMVERFPLATWGKDDARSWHVIGEAMQLAYADRDAYQADPDFVDVPVGGLIDPAYIRTRSRTIALGRTLPSYGAGTPPGAPARTPVPSGEVAGTTHFVAVDDDGDVVSWTNTVESAFGSQLAVNGYVLNNELTDFSLAPAKDGHLVANRVQAGKRPLSSMAPTIVYDRAGKPVFAVGAAGGKTIIMQVAKALIAHFDWGLSAQDSIALGLIYFNRDGLVLEQGTSTAAFAAPLTAMGHKVSVDTLGLKANAAEKLPDGRWVGAADPRSPGTSLQQ
ncbi:gamma-glutamyltranspeptidase [Sphingomonas sp. Leaf412]|uniref:gamma-glutamyltransferase n=1 Tax=Sphingomonas sp. Leaf412 TaxID=1736370 RepID=UPI0006FD5460|nr:gamma-glutamyltransferase [Sphingomonas sp. Leaf412]KQT32489.1 gamma-glutamyltranspeptidase [Sphingomonas sp. Leaf412]